MGGRRVGVAVLLLFGFLGGSLCGFSQGIAQTSGQATVDMVLSYLHSIATYIGKGLVSLLNLVTNDRVSRNLEEPLGYLGLITALLLVFGIIEAARKIIWIAIGVGWVLLIIRIVLDALRT